MNKEGIRRLSLFLGTVGSIGWLIFVLIETDFFSGSIEPKGWFIIFAGILFFFIIPYGIVKGVDWVVDGFKRDRQHVEKK